MSRRFTRLALVTASVLAVATAPACASVPPADPAGAASSWQRGADFPLAARTAPITVWTGVEVFVVGGDVGPPCPANASCAGGDLTADGAAYDPATDTWREIAPAPTAMGFGAGAYVDGQLFVGGSVADGPGILLSYDIASDRWARLEIPDTVPSAAQPVWYTPVADGDRLLLVSGSDENGEVPDLVFDPQNDTWSELPADPLGPTYDRMLTPTEHGLVLTAKELVADPGSEVPSLTIAAILDDGTGEWNRLPDTGQIGGWAWAVDGDRMVDPQVGGADGGQIGNWGREYPFGGVLTLPGGEWSALPSTPRPRENRLGDITGSRYSVSAGYLYDDRAGTWTPLDAPTSPVSAALWADERLFVLGHAPSEVWVLTPPASPAG